MQTGIAIINEHADYSTRNLMTIETLDQYFSLSGITDPIIVEAVKGLFYGLQTDGLWSKAYAVYPLAGATATSQRYSIKDTADNVITWVNDAPGAHTVLGYTASVAPRYGEYVFPFSGAPNISLGVYNSTNAQTSGHQAMAKLAPDNDNRIYIGRYISSVTQVNMGRSTTNPIGPGSSYTEAKKGFLCGQRINNAVTLYDEGVQIASGTDTNNFVAGTRGYLGISDPQNGTSANRWAFNEPIGFNWVGSGLTPHEHALLNARVVAYCTAVGR
ncbi:hypothetical protein DJ568_15540 [Mucilaginibacter hurinus]|uniref:Uncharacterized protein n=1 Tax=Mucilaginibacter hurinus TaxID=2201324 RepID=A0A367GMN7_9SPHI|nr:hypothetical protein [Mucilaginibacter hurinus]RCH53951.1 hypothetical protein DJ568_15540 [Mucilaginibacter hurinus]